MIHPVTDISIICAIEVDWGSFMRKIKILIGSFLILLVLSLDLGTIFSHQPVKEREQTQTDYFTVKNVQHNVTCIALAVREMVMDKINLEKKGISDQYANAVAEQTTKTVEQAIINEKQNK